MPKAVLKNGVIVPLEPLPENWQDGQDLVIAADPEAESDIDIDEWYAEMEELCADATEEDSNRLQEFLEAKRRADKLGARIAMTMSIWVFNGEGSRFPAAVFSDRERAEEWIRTRKVSGCLTRYPIDTSVNDCAQANGHFQPRHAAQTQLFNSAHQEHYHYKAGTQEGTPFSRDPKGSAERSR